MLTESIETDISLTIDNSSVGEAATTGATITAEEAVEITAGEETDITTVEVTVVSREIASCVVIKKDITEGETIGDMK